MTDTSPSARRNQRLRTRKDLLAAAARLLADGCAPTMAEVAEAALVSRATAYRYFPSLEALLAEAPLEGQVPDPQTLFDSAAPADPGTRVAEAEAALYEMVCRNELKLRTMLAHSIARGADSRRSGDVPIRQNRRMALIEAALAPARNRFKPEIYDELCAALALMFGPESLIVFRDVLCLKERKARAVKSWAVRALVREALRESADVGGSPSPRSAT